MNIHLLALVKWLLRSMFGALSASGDVTDGTTMKDPEEEADYPPLEEKRCRLLTRRRRRTRQRRFRLKMLYYVLFHNICCLLDKTTKLPLYIDKVFYQKNNFTGALRQLRPKKGREEWFALPDKEAPDHRSPASLSS